MASPKPKRSLQSARTSSGVRWTIAEFIRVLPPTQRPLKERHVRSPLDDLRASIAEHPPKRAVDVIIELARLHPWAFLHDGNREARACEDVCRDGTGGPRTNHHVVESIFYREVLAEERAVDDGPLGETLIGKRWVLSWTHGRCARRIRKGMMEREGAGTRIRARTASFPAYRSAPMAFRIIDSDRIAYVGLATRRAIAFSRSVRGSVAAEIVARRPSMKMGAIAASQMASRKPRAARNGTE